MYAIKARFDGSVIIPTEDIPVTGPYEAIITFTRPMENVTPAETVDDCSAYGNLAKFHGCFRENSPWNGDSVEIIRKMRDEW
jgi:hypothetical protein